jgi:DNA-binding beta-propeller fold protein YncE
VFDGEQTTYYLRSLTATTSLFTVPDNESDAVWSTDDHYVFISTTQGIAQIDVQNRKVYHILSASGAKYLQYYRDGYLYYLNSQDGATGVLNRIDIAHGRVQPVTSACASGKSFWLNPVGTQVYYVCEQEQDGLFVVNSDGTNAHVLRTQAGPIIGYAADAAPLVLAYTSGKYRVAKLGADQSQDQAILDDVVPGGGLIPSGAIAVAPFGYTLVARGVYDDHEAIWYGDLTSGQKHQAMKIEKGTQVRLYGWSRMQVP